MENEIREDLGENIIRKLGELKIALEKMKMERENEKEFSNSYFN